MSEMKGPRYSKRDAQLAEDWKAIARTAEGRRVIADIMTWANVYSQIEESEPIRLALRVGEENVAKRIAYYLGYRPEHYAQIAEEHTDLLSQMVQSLSQH